MATMIETDLKEVLDKIDSRLERLEKRLEEDMTELKIGQARMDEKITALADRVGFQEFLNRSFIVGIGIAVLTGLAKILGFLPNS